MRSPSFLPALTAATALSLTGCLDRSPVGPAESALPVAAKSAGVRFEQVTDEAASAITVGSDGTFYFLTFAKGADGNAQLWKQTGPTTWVPLPGPSGTGVKVAAGAANQYMLIKANDALYQVIGTTMTAMGSAKDITVKTHSYRLNTTVATTGGYTLSKRDGNAWNVIVGSGNRIAVAPNGDLWALNAGTIWRLRAGETKWWQIPGWAQEITVSFDGTVYVIGKILYSGGYKIHRYVPSADNNPYAGEWKDVEFGGSSLAGGLGRSLYVRTTSSRVFYSPDP